MAIITTIEDRMVFIEKKEFFDLTYLEYGWEPKNLPKECVFEGKYNIDHTSISKTDGFITLRHKEVVDVTAGYLSRVCKDVSKEPVLSSTQTSSDDC